MPDDAKEVPKGQRFTQLYSERGKPTQDSTKMRRRLASLIDSIDAFHTGDPQKLSQRAEKELGIATPWSQHGTWREFLAKWDLQDILDLVTIAYRLLVQQAQADAYARFHHRNFAQEWITEVRRIFQEENVHYTVDSAGGVHFQFDEQFAKDRRATIATLQGERYTNARHAFDGAMEAFAKAPPDGKNALRGVFSAAENVFKLITSKNRLGAKEADELGPIIEKLYAADDTARNSAKRMLVSLKDWVDAAHFYRHEPGKEGVAQPPLSLAVYLVSTGASHLRWLAELDSASVPH
jgi:hypothetical protein